MADTLTHSAATSAGDFSRGRLVLADGTVFEGQSFGADNPPPTSRRNG